MRSSEVCYARSFLALGAEVSASASHFDLSDCGAASGARLAGHAVDLQHVLVVSAFVVGTERSDGGSSVDYGLVDDPFAMLDDILDLFLSQLHGSPFRMHPGCKEDLISVDVTNAADDLLIQ